MNKLPCAVCDVERLELSPIQAFALGLGVREHLEEHRPIASQMCERHRTPTAMAMLSVAQKIVGVKSP